MTITYTIPAYIADAFFTVYAYGADAEGYERFASRWGGLDLPTFRHIAQQGQGDDKLAALFALGNLVNSETTEFLASFLTSSHHLERSLCAVLLAKRDDERAFPVLYQLLRESISIEDRRWLQENTTGERAEEITWLLYCLNEAVPLLAQRNDPALIPLLHKEFRQHWEAERVVLGQGHRYVYYYDTLAYALGHLGDFTVLHDLNLPPAYRNLAMLYMAMGALDYHISSLTEFQGNGMEPAIKQQIANLLAQHFGLSEQEQQDYMRNAYLYGQMRGTKHALTEVDDEFDRTSILASRNFTEDELEDDEDGEETEQVPWIDPTFTCTYEGHKGRIHSLSWSPNSKCLASASGDGTVQVWNATTGEMLLTFHRHIESVNAVSWSPQGTYIASAGNDGLVYVWEATSGKPVTIYKGHRAWINKGLAWSPDGTHIASASWDHTVQVWEALTGKLLQTFRAHNGVVCSLAWSPDGCYIVSGGGYPECLIHVWEAETGAVALTYRDHTRDEHQERILSKHLDPLAEEDARRPGSVHYLAWSPDGKWIASAGEHAIFRVWNASTGQNVLSRNEVLEPMTWSADNRFVITLAGFDFHHVAQWSVADDRPLLVYKSGCHGNIQALACSPDGQLMAASSWFTDVKVWKTVPPEDIPHNT